MKKIPESLVSSLRKVKGFDEQAFLDVHADPVQLTSIRLNPSKVKLPPDELSVESVVPWTQFGYYLTSRPSFTFDPLFHAGCYYVQEASSMFLEHALLQTTDISKALKVLDLSAAPGGKSTHLQSLLSPASLLVSNEVIRSRANILKDNIIKWGTANVVVTHNDPRDFARLPDYFDVIVVDAPCSGSGLFRRDPEAIDEWSPQNVAMCSQRQQRILADVWPSLKKDGIIIYSTCSYSAEEDEDIVEWIKADLGATNVMLDINPEWGIVESGGGYRFWPDKVKGEGFFLACFRKEDGETSSALKARKSPELLTKSEVAIAAAWIDNEDWKMIRHEQTVYAWPQDQYADFNLLLNVLRVIYSGTIIGELMRDKLVPDHALAMSPHIAAGISMVPLDKENAIAYLKRTELRVEHAKKGWQLASYEGHALGWMNVLPNRINNYYPKELRILKDKQA